jgi:hypothetical protein
MTPMLSGVELSLEELDVMQIHAKQLTVEMEMVDANLEEDSSSQPLKERLPCLRTSKITMTSKLSTESTWVLNLDPQMLQLESMLMTAEIQDLCILEHLLHLEPGSTPLLLTITIGLGLEAPIAMKILNAEAERSVVLVSTLVMQI